MKIPTLASYSAFSIITTTIFLFAIHDRNDIRSMSGSIGVESIIF